MAITKSGKKAHRQSLKKAVINVRRRTAMKDTIKNIRDDIANKAKGGALEKLKLAYKTLDKAAKRGVIKKGTANRKKSRLAKAIAKLA